MADETLVLELISIARTEGINKMDKAIETLTAKTNQFNNLMRRVKDIRSFIAQEKMMNRAGMSLGKFNEMGRKGAVVTDMLTGEVMSQSQVMQRLYDVAFNVGGITEKINGLFKEELTLTQKIVKWSNKFRMGWLGMMFAAKRLREETEKSIRPAEELLGVNELRNKLTAIKTLPLAIEEMKATIQAAEAWEKKNEVEKKNELTILKITRAVASFLEKTSESILALWAFLNVGKDVVGFFKWMKGKNMDDVKNALGGVKDAFVSIWDNLKGAGSKVKDFFSALTKKESWTKLKDALTGLGSKLKDVGSSVTTFITDKFGAMKSDSWFGLENHWLKHNRCNWRWIRCVWISTAF